MMLSRQSPTHVQVTVQRAKGLLIKGKHGTNDAFVTIALGKEKFQTSVKEKATDPVDWQEECELAIPKQGNTAEITLTVLHRNFLGVDEFLGMVKIPLSDFDTYDRPLNRRYTLQSKPGKEKTKYRGELDVRVAFSTKAGSLNDLSKKEGHKGSLSHISHMAQSVGGSLLSLGSREGKSLKKLAKSVGNKVATLPHRGKKKKKDGNLPGEGFQTIMERRSGQSPEEADPGVISEGEDDDDFCFEELSHKSSGSSLAAPPTGLDGSLEDLAGGEFLRKNYSTPPAKPVRSQPQPPPPVLEPMDEWEAKLFGIPGNKAGSTTVTPTAITTPRPRDPSPPPAPRKEETNHHPVVSEILPPRLNNGDGAIYETPVRKEHPEEVEKPKKKEGIGKKIAHLANRTGGSLFDLPSAGKASKHLEEPKTPWTLHSVVSSPGQLSSEVKRVVEGGENTDPVSSSTSRLPGELLRKFEGRSREDLIEMVCQLQGSVDQQSRKVKDLEEYIDSLLLRVMETTPRILQNPYVAHKPPPTIKHG